MSIALLPRFELALVCLLSVFCQISVAQDVPDNDFTESKSRPVPSDFEKPLSFWLDRLEVGPEAERTHAVEVISQAAYLAREFRVSQMKDQFPQMLGYPAQSTVDGPDGNDHKNGERFAGEFRDAEDRLIRLLEAHPIEPSFNEDNTASAVALGLCVSSFDGSALIRARNRLPPGIQRDGLLMNLIAFCPQMMPRDKTLSSILLPELRSLSAETRVALAHEWDQTGIGVDDRSESRDLKSLSLGLLTPLVAMQFCARDHIQQELPLFIELLKPEWPQLLRCMSLGCLAELRHEAEPALPQLTQLLADESLTIRELAACAILYVRTDERLVADYSERFAWSVERCKELTDDLARIRSAMQRILDESNSATATRESVIECLQRGTNIERRVILRAVREMGSGAITMKPLVRECLNDEEELTRTFAAQALEVISQSEQSK